MPQPLLELENVSARYGPLRALFDVSLRVDAGEVLAIVGANGAGKSTLLKAVTGLVPNKGQMIRFAGRDLGGMRPEAIHRLGIALVPEGRRLFASLTVEENLLIGALGKRAGPWTLERVYALFPDLEARKSSPGTALSGGQQQMVAVGRALMSNPDLLLCDELSLGLSPKVVGDIYARLPEIRGTGTALMIVEQDAHRAKAAADRLLCLQDGRVTLEGAADALDLQQIADAYFGTQEAA
ncbi:ABC transporter ATP-binding protein [Sulfitobacter sp. S190]|uniref:ABC transporter ATP-binding protein n=1 Tax=Sulfitobacter sp. S190 TaxID=2867022 RepID=UPI0021A85B30|nr:ABC transporter ATP-binding protein [Sulfitobacter sp. S190]UWR23173.1 ABC transporter ATP-binding protein [Sulfitobacter sp. S190]